MFVIMAMMVRSFFPFRRGSAAVIALLALAAGQLLAQASRYEDLRQQAAAYYSEKSYRLAHDAWREAAELGVPDEDRRILDFYLADSLWRSRPDAEEVKAARAELKKIAEDDGAGPLAAEAWESLGDSWLAIEGDWNRAWPDYQRALEDWAASTDIDRARARYLGIVWKATGPPGDDYRVRRVPLEVLANAVEIATSTEDRARAHFFLGVRLGAGDIYSIQRAGSEFQAAVDAGPGTAVYEQALFKLGEWQANYGGSKWNADGSLRPGPDYQAALKTFRRFVKEFPEGKSSLWSVARDEIRNITEPALTLTVWQQCLPGARPGVQASWRNVGEVTFTLSKVDLVAAFQPTAQTQPGQWLDAVNVASGDMVRQWKEPGADSHVAVGKSIELDAIEEPGTYVLEAAAGRRKARALLVVTEAAAVVRPVGNSATVFLCNARTGARAEGDVVAKVWRVSPEADRGDRFVWTSVDPASVDAGLVRFDFPPVEESYEGLLLFAGIGSQPAVVDTAQRWRTTDFDEWRIQVFTDRAAYRPGDRVRWRLIARTVKGGELLTPAGELLKFRIVDPRGETFREGEVKLTEFGGAWGELEVGTDAPLGEFSIQFARDDRPLGGDRLFRLEEYRLPELKVGVSVAADSGVRLGDEFVAEVSAEYYFGGPVADAQVTVVVKEGPNFRPLPAMEARGRIMPPSFHPEKTVLNETVRTGPDGRALVRVRTPFDASGDRRYVIEARVVDASGREVVGESSIVVARQSYFVELTPSRRVGQPGDAIQVAIATKDGNDRKVSTNGVVVLSRQRWTEVWRDPQGHEVSGEELDKLRRGIFPPAGQPGWVLVRQEYVSEEISRTDVSTNAEGEASFSFSPAEPGFYRIAWSSPDADGPPVTGETTVWVSSAAGGMIGYRSGGVEIIVDPDAPAKGGQVPVLITTNTSNRDVLFTVNAGSDLFRAEVVHLDGDSKLVMLDSEERFVPNVAVTADSVLGLEVHSDVKEIRFPPFRNTLAVELTPTPEQAAPGSDARLDVVVKDWEGRPVRGEFAIAVTDEAISYIQQDYAGDPVEFFLGRQRPIASQMMSSIFERPFQRGETEGMGEPAAGGLLHKSLDMMASRSFASGMAVEATADAAEAPVVAGQENAVQVRTDFSATAFWQPGVVTDSEGRASVSFRYPDSLTTWRVVARGASAEASFGFAETATKTTKPLIARLQAPRFLVAGDTVEISGVVNNRTDAALDAKVDLRTEGLDGTPKSQTLQIAADRDSRASWTLSAPNPGNARLTLTAVSGDLNDGMAVDLNVFPNGIDKAVSVSGKAVEAESEWVLDISAERRPGSESLVVTATPSLAAAALDALPYLVRYPYGCVEQTMSRFLPAVVTLGTLENLGLDRQAIANRMFGGIEPEFLSRTHPDFTGDAGLEELNAVVSRGLDRLYDFQHEDGAWGWWKHDDADAFMTAYVVWGLRLAQKSGVGVKAEVLERGTAWLRRHLVNEKDHLDRQAWLLHALAAQFSKGGKLSDEEAAAIANLWERRDELTAYGRALFALAVNAYGDQEKAETLARNLHDGVTRDAQPGVSQATGAGTPNSTAVPTAHWGSDGMFRRWQDGGVEATAFALQALLAIDPSDDLVEPAMNWLVKNRRGAQWSNTRDTAIVVLAMNAYLARTKELGAEVGFEIEVNGKPAGRVEKATALDGRTEFEIDRTLLVDGPNRIVLRRTSGSAPVYFSARAEFFTMEQPIPAAGNEVFAEREYFRYAPERTLLDGYRFNRVEWAEDQASLTDQRVEVVLTIEAKNDLEYLVFEDLKPAGLEAVEVRSGERMVAEGADGKTIPVYCELRDRKVALFVRALPQGVWKIRYDLRAETAGDFSALPVVGHAMYVPEIRCNGTSRRVRIEASR